MAAAVGAVAEQHYIRAQVLVCAVTAAEAAGWELVSWCCCGVLHRGTPSVVLQRSR